MSLVLLLAAAAVGGLVLDRLDVPGGLIVGAMIGAAVVSIARGDSEIVVPSALQAGAFVVLGAVIGASVTRGTLVDLRGQLVPAVLAAVVLIGVGIAIAVVLRLTGVAPPSVVLATSPGALSAMSAAAADQGVGAAEVALFQTVRVVLVLLSLPLLLRLAPG